MKRLLLIVILLFTIGTGRAQEVLEPVGSLYHFLNYPFSARISGDYLYVGKSNGGMSVLGISDIENPEFVEFIDVLGRPHTLEDSLLFLTFRNGVNIYDVSNPVEVTYKSTLISSGRSMYGFAYSDDIAVIFSETFISDEYRFEQKNHYFEVFNLSDPDNPELSYRLQDDDGFYTPWGYSLILSGDMLYFEHEWDQDIAIYTLSDPTQPEHVGNFGNLNSPIGIYRAGNILYTTPGMEIDQRIGTLEAYDVSDPENVEVLARVDSVNWYSGIEILDSLIFVSNWLSDNVTVYNAVDPDDIVVWSEFETEIPSKILCAKSNVCVTVDTLGLLEIIDLSDPEDVIITAMYDISGEIFGVSYNHNISCIAAGEGGVRFVNVSDPENLEEIGIWNDDAEIVMVDMDDQLLVACESDSFVYFIDVTDPTNPSEHSRLQILNNFVQLFVKDDYVYLLLEGLGLLIYDVSDPSQPSLTGRINGHFGMFQISGDDLYFNQDWNIIHYDINDKSSPHHVQDITVIERGQDIWNGHISSFIIEGGKVYLTYNGWINDYNDYVEMTNYIIADIGNPNNVRLLSNTVLERGRSVTHMSSVLGIINNNVFLEIKGEVHVYDSWNNRRPTFLGRLNNVSRVQDMAISGNHAIVSDLNEILIYDISELLGAPTIPANPLPNAISLSTYPNPFNDALRLTIRLSQPANISLAVYDLQGRLIKELESGYQQAGKITRSVSGFESGIYFVVLESMNETKVQKIVCLK